MREFSEKEKETTISHTNLPPIGHQLSAVNLNETNITVNSSLERLYSQSIIGLRDASDDSSSQSKLLIKRHQNRMQM